jgi:hypothetical protein
MHCTTATHAVQGTLFYAIVPILSYAILIVKMTSQAI